MKPKPDDIDKHVGGRIREARKESGISMEDLAKAIGVSYQQIQKYETGLNRVSCGRIWQIANAFDKPILYFFPGWSEQDD